MILLINSGPRRGQDFDSRSFSLARPVAGCKASAALTYGRTLALGRWAAWPDEAKAAGVTHEIACICHSRHRCAGGRWYCVSPNVRFQLSCVHARLWRPTWGTDGLHLPLARPVCSFGARSPSHLPGEPILFPSWENEASANLRSEGPEVWQSLLAKARHRTQAKGLRNDAGGLHFTRGTSALALLLGYLSASSLARRSAFNRSKLARNAASALAWSFIACSASILRFSCLASRSTLEAAGFARFS